MSVVPTPDDYTHRELFLSHDLDAITRTVLIEHGTDPDALMLDMLRDAIADQMHVAFAARDSASLALVTAAFRRLVHQATSELH